MTDSILREAETSFDKAIDHLKNEYSKLQIGRASAGLVESLMVEAYGGMQQLRTLAQITIPESRTISISAWDKSLLKNIETSILAANLGLNPNNNGESILINIPPLTEERRKDLTKVVHKLAEDAKIVIRQGRQKSLQQIKDMEKTEEISKDQSVGAEKKLQEKVDTANNTVEELSKSKESEVLTI